VTWQTVVSAEEVARRLDDVRLRIFDCRYSLGDPAAGRLAYSRGHLPGAVYVDLHDDLAGPRSQGSGRHPLPDPAAFAARLRAWGVEEDSRLLAYDEASGMWASRFWWMATRWFGHPRVAVLDGGLQRWTSLGLPVTTEVPPQRAPGRFVGRVDDTVVVDAATTRQAAARSTARVLDARAPERYRGEIEPIDAVAGHIPGALNHPASRIVTPAGTLLPAEALREQFEQTLAGGHPGDVIAYCGSGVTACHLLLALERAGLPGARLYAGSWSEWSADPSRPVATGSD
jgi:thiosulfate/3-mercaptopyruvate sulfurtransferase